MFLCYLCVIVIFESTFWLCSILCCLLLRIFNTYSSITSTTYTFTTLLRVKLLLILKKINTIALKINNEVPISLPIRNLSTFWRLLTDAFADAGLFRLVNCRIVAWFVNKFQLLLICGIQCKSISHRGSFFLLLLLFYD